MAAGVIAFDKYFGLAIGWIRTELALEAALGELRYDWVAGPDSETKLGCRAVPGHDPAAAGLHCKGE
jgi:hypothetical protein